MPKRKSRTERIRDDLDNMARHMVRWWHGISLDDINKDSDTFDSFKRDLQDYEEAICRAISEGFTGREIRAIDEWISGRWTLGEKDRLRRPRKSLEKNLKREITLADLWLLENWKDTQDRLSEDDGEDYARATWEALRDKANLSRPAITIGADDSRKPFHLPDDDKARLRRGLKEWENYRKWLKRLRRIPEPAPIRHRGWKSKGWESPKSLSAAINKKRGRKILGHRPMLRKRRTKRAITT